MVLLTSEVAMVVVMSNGGRAVVLRGGNAVGTLGNRITKLPMPIQKAMARPTASPTTAP